MKEGENSKQIIPAGRRVFGIIPPSIPVYPPGFGIFPAGNRLSTTVGKPADNCEQACRQLSTGNRQQKNFGKNASKGK